MSADDSGAPAPRAGLGPARERVAKQALEGGASVASAAKACGLSRSYFIRAFRRTTGQPPHRWALHRRLEIARDLLVDGRQTIADIASICGFADQSHLTRSFRDRWGDSPARYRRATRPCAIGGDR